MSIAVVYTVLILAIGLCCLFIGIRLETMYYNKGICPVCNGKYEIFDIDSQGSRGYECDTCGNVIWVSYPCVDK